MNILRKVTWQAMKKNRTRTVVTVIGVILSAAMFTAVTTLGISLWSYLVDMEIANRGDYYGQISYTSADHAHAISQDQRVSQSGTLGILGYTTLSLSRENGHEISETYAIAAGDAAFYQMVSVRLEEGRLPQTSQEIVISGNAYYYLKEAGQPCEIGQTVTLSADPRYSPGKADGNTSLVLPDDGEPFSKTYTIVGIAEIFTRLNDFDLHLSHFFTCTGAETPLWYRVYFKTGIPSDTYDMIAHLPEGTAGSTNNTLLSFYGATQYNEYNTVIAATCCILAAIIMVSSISLIYNAFSISVAERTRQFGLLSSIGATRKQIRHAVFSEALTVSLMGIPIGLACGYAGIWVTLYLLADRVASLFAGEAMVSLRAVLSPLALLTAAAVALVTVLISAALPARRATRVTPLEAIRQQQDYSVPRRIPSHRISLRLFDLPGMLSAKYYSISRKKYRNTIISLALSVILFLSAASITRSLQQSVDLSVDAENFDICCHGDNEKLEELRNQDFVSQSAYAASDYFLTYVTDDQRSASFLEAYPKLQDDYEGIQKNIPKIHIYYLEDAVFAQYLKENHIPAGPYLQSDTPTALVISQDVTTYTFQGGEAQRYNYRYDPFDAEGDILQMFPDGIPQGLTPFGTDEPGSVTYAYCADNQGRPILSLMPIVTKDDIAMTMEDEHIDYLMVAEPENSQTLIRYYRLSADGTPAPEPEAVTTSCAPRIRLGKTVDSLPFGISRSAKDSYYYTALVLPMSQAPAETAEVQELLICVSDYPAAIVWLEQNLGIKDYTDYRANEEANRTLLLIINVFCYGFIVLICMICIANVFNTISTNVALRRRDFGMLRSVGFRQRDVKRMLLYECLTYGLRALVWGLPVSLVISYLIHRMDRGISNAVFVPPWGAIGLSVVCIFLVVTVTMFYALSRLRKDAPIDAIRMENI